MLYYTNIIINAFLNWLCKIPIIHLDKQKPHGFFVGHGEGQHY